MSAAITPEELYRNYHDRVERYIGARVGNVHDRVDVQQQVFLNAVSALDSYDPARSALGTWLYAITRNAVIDYYRTKSREPVPAEWEESAFSASGIDERILTQETLEELAAALEQLPERERRIIILRYYHGLSARETAQKVGVSYANVRFLQYSALNKLRRCLGEAEH